MKKSNVTVIATVLIALHVLVFALFVGKHNERKQRPKSAALPTPVETQTPSEPTPPKEKPKHPQPEIVSVETMKPAPRLTQRTVSAAGSREKIAVPGTREGYLRADRPNRRTRKVYSKLVGNPYMGAIVIDARTGKILYEQRASTYAYPASVTKLMTMLVIFEQIDAGRISLNDKVAITKEGISIRNSRPSQAFLDTRESGAFTVDDLLKAVLIHSACDASQVLAIHVAGSRSAFIDMMNQKARELGMNSTTYHTEHGLPPVDGTQPDISTAYDIAILSQACLRHPETLKYTSIKLEYLPQGPIRKERFMLANRNALVGKDPYQGCDGLKTGFHDMGGWSLAATAERNGQRVVAIILGSPDKTTRTAHIRKLLNKGFEALNK